LLFLHKSKKAKEAIIRKFFYSSDVEIAFDKELDCTTKVYNAKKGNAETADALYYLTRCNVK